MTRLPPLERRELLFCALTVCCGQPVDHGAQDICSTGQVVVYLGSHVGKNKSFDLNCQLDGLRFCILRWVQRSPGPLPGAIRRSDGPSRSDVYTLALPSTLYSLVSACTTLLGCKEPLVAMCHEPSVGPSSDSSAKAAHTIHP